jgi:hypothetical protein
VIAPIAELDSVFVLRLWLERESERVAPAHWRASIRYINTGEIYYANGIEDTFRIVRDLLSEGPGLT